MINPIITRRGFLQALGAIGVAGAMPAPLLSLPDAVLPVEGVDDAALDAPITVDNPLMWIELAGKRLPLLDVSLQMSRALSAPSLGKIGKFYSPSTDVELVFTTPVTADITRFFGNRTWYSIEPFRLWVPGFGRVISGDLTFNSMRGDAEVFNASVAIVGDLIFHS